MLSEDGVCKVSLAGDVSIPARAEVTIGGKLEGLCEGPNVGMFEPNGNVFDQHDVLVARVVVSSRPEQIPLRVVNMSTEPVMLYKGTQIGCFEMGVAVLEEGSSASNLRGEGNEWNTDSLSTALNLSGKGLTDDQLAGVKETLSHHLSVFSTGDVDLGRTHLAYHQIHTGDSRPIKMNPRKIPVHFERCRSSVRTNAKAGDYSSLSKPVGCPGSHCA